MSLNAIEVLEAKLEHRRQQRIVEWFEAIGALPRIANSEDIGVPYCSLYDATYPPYHSPEWWDMMWTKHEEWRLETYPPEAGTGYEVTPVTGVEIK